MPGLRVDYLLVGLTLLVLLVACTNLANLMLSRGALRLHEFAVRRALGASRWRLVRELIVEGAIITVIAAGSAIALTRVMMALATLEVPTAHGPVFIDPELNVSALLFASTALLVIDDRFWSRAGAQPYAQYRQRPSGERSRRRRLQREHDDSGRSSAGRWPSRPASSLSRRFSSEPSSPKRATTRGSRSIGSRLHGALRRPWLGRKPGAQRGWSVRWS